MAIFDKSLECSLRELGYNISFVDDYISNVSKDKSTSLILSGEIGGCYEYHTINKLPIKKLITLEWIIQKINKKSSYTNLCKKFQKLLKSDKYCSGYTCYATTYGIGVHVAMNSRHNIENAKINIESVLSSYGIKYSTEYSSEGWVFRYKISKCKSNLEKIK